MVLVADRQRAVPVRVVKEDPHELRSRSVTALEQLRTRHLIARDVGDEAARHDDLIAENVVAVRDGHGDLAPVRGPSHGVEITVTLSTGRSQVEIRIRRAVLDSSRVHRLAEVEHVLITDAHRGASVDVDPRDSRECRSHGVDVRQTLGADRRVPEGVGKTRRRDELGSRHGKAARQRDQDRARVRAPLNHVRVAVRESPFG